MAFPTDDGRADESADLSFLPQSSSAIFEFAAIPFGDRPISFALRSYFVCTGVNADENYTKWSSGISVISKQVGED